jgi:prepilin-type N-terminal cleavage/methylation domain-containing protein
MHTNKHEHGFTLVEMLVVIGVIGILAAALLSTFGHVQRAARQAEAQSLVGEAAAALTLYLQKEREWPEEWLGKKDIDTEICWYLQKSKLLDVTPYKTLGMEPLAANIDEKSPDRCGLLDPWGRRAIKRVKEKDAGPKTVPSGGTIEDHRLQVRFDENYDGWVDGSEGLPSAAGRVRASVAVWSRGPDGQDDDWSRKGGPKDDSLSWPFHKFRSE